MANECRPNLQADGFRGLLLLGSGTQGSVYSSFDEKLQHMVAVKKIGASTPSQQERLKKEIIALRSRTHVSHELKHLHLPFFPSYRPKRLKLFF
jgi:serine/threonine protein kinase